MVGFQRYQFCMTSVAEYCGATLVHDLDTAFQHRIFSCATVHLKSDL